MNIKAFSNRYGPRAGGGNWLVLATWHPSATADTLTMHGYTSQDTLIHVGVAYALQRDVVFALQRYCVLCVCMCVCVGVCVVCCLLGVY